VTRHTQLKQIRGETMAVICPDCGRQYDVSLFAFGRIVRCVCGQGLRAEHRMNAGGPRHARQAEARRGLHAFQRKADRVASLVLAGDIPDVDVEIAINELRQRCRELYPDTEYLFELIYESRFRRLWEQFREPSV